MNKSMPTQKVFFRHRSSEKGAVLIVGLVMLLLMTIVGMAAIRGTGLQELMAGSMRDKNLAFQSAEAGLRTAEELLVNPASLSFNNSNGLYTDLGGEDSNLDIAVNWSDSDWESNSQISSLSLAGLSAQPRYVIEELSRLPEAGAQGGAVDFSSQLDAEESVFYRVTSRGQGGSDTAVVVLQSIIR